MNTGQDTKLTKPYQLTIGGIIKLLEKHFSYQYNDAGAARLPVLAVYAVYQCLMKQFSRYAGKTLCPL